MAEVRIRLQQRLMAAQQRQAQQQAAMLADGVTTALLQLLRSGTDASQTALLDHAIADQLAAQLSCHQDSDSGFSLDTLLDQVCLLAADEARQHGIELHPLVFDDLPRHFHGNPEPLRGLLVMLCTDALRDMETGAIIIRAMLDESSADGDQPDGETRICFSLQRDCTTNTPGWTDPVAECRELTASLGAHLQTVDDEQHLLLSLTADHRYRGPVLPNPLDTRVISVFHPCAAARHSLNYRLRRMNLHATPVEHIGDVDSVHSVALLLALPAEYDIELALALATSQPVTLLIVLSNAPPPADLAAEISWLPAGINDQRLYQQLLHTLRQAEPPATQALTAASPEPVQPNSTLPQSLQQLFLSDFPKALSDLRACQQRNDRNALKSLSHKLKGGAAYCDLPALYQVARHLDQAAPCAPASIIDYLLQRLEMEAASANADDMPKPS